VPLAAGVRLVLTEPSEDDRFKVAAFVEVYAIVIVVVALPEQVG
jgi:hypothetical protein